MSAATGDPNPADHPSPDSPPEPATRKTPDPRGAALTILSWAVVAAAAGGAGWVLYRFVTAFSHVLLPLAVGALGALVLRPWFRAFHTRLRLPAWAALTAVFLSVLLALTVFGVVFGRRIATQTVELAAALPALMEQIRAFALATTPAVIEFLETHPIGRQLREFALAHQAELFQGLTLVGEGAYAASAGILRGVGGLLSWAVLPLYFGYFLVSDPPRVDPDRALPFLSPHTRETVTQLTRRFIAILTVFFRAQLLVALLQGILIAIGFTAIGLQYGFLLGLSLGVLTVIPYLGTGVGFLIAVPLGWMQPDGGLALAAMAAGVLVVVQLIEGWVLTPRIMGKETGLHWMAIIVAVLFWSTALSGLTGTILAIPLTAFAASAWRVFRERYLLELL